MGFGPPSTKITIFDSMPDPTSATFSSGLPALSTQQESLAVIFYSPNLQMLISLDNSGSQAECSYSASVTTGFTFSSTESFSITDSVGVNFEIATANVSVTFALSFTEEWSKSTTKTMSFTCPASQKAFVYQGTLKSRILKFDPGTGDYSWYNAEAKALTEVLVTKGTPVDKAPSNSVSITKQL